MASTQIISKRLAEQVSTLRFHAPVEYVYNPLVYAWEPHFRYLRRYGRGPREVLVVGMNPGPFGMAQTGVPFGDIPLVRDWLGIEGKVEKPPREHPRSPVKGFSHHRREESGKRFWGWAQARYKTPERFFERFFVHNYCPLCFLAAGGQNVSVSELRAVDKHTVFPICDEALRQFADCFKPRYIVGIGRFSEKRIHEALPDFRGTAGYLPHPSRRNPRTGADYGAAADKALRELGIT